MIRHKGSQRILISLSSRVVNSTTLEKVLARYNSKVVAIIVTVTTKAMMMKEGLGFTVSQVETLRAKEQLMGGKITVGQLRKLHKL